MNQSHIDEDIGIAYGNGKWIGKMKIWSYYMPNWSTISKGLLKPNWGVAIKHDCRFRGNNKMIRSWIVELIWEILWRWPERSSFRYRVRIETEVVTLIEGTQYLNMANRLIWEHGKLLICARVWKRHHINFLFWQEWLFILIK